MSYGSCALLILLSLVLVWRDMKIPWTDFKSKDRRDCVTDAPTDDYDKNSMFPHLEGAGA